MRNVLSWVFVLAGFKPNIAEELTGNEFENGRESEHEKDHPKANVKPAPVKDANGNQQAQPQSEPAGGMDVFATLESELADFCEGDGEKMQEKLQALTSFVNKEGKEIPGKRFVGDLQKSKTGGTKWAGSALEKLRREVAGER